MPTLPVSIRPGLRNLKPGFNRRRIVVSDARGRDFSVIGLR